MIHLIKLSVGPDSLADLEAWQKQYYKKHGELIHVTRQTPKRADELLSGGSIYWVIGGFIVGRQKLLELRPATRQGIPHCGLIYDPKMVRVVPRPHRPFQGWRYLEAKSAPSDLDKAGAANLPDEMQKELALLGLL